MFTLFIFIIAVSLLVCGYSVLIAIRAEEFIPEHNYNKSPVIF